MNIKAKNEPIVEDWWQETIDKFIDEIIFSRTTLSLNLSSLSFENKGLEWHSLIGK